MRRLDPILLVLAASLVAAGCGDGGAAAAAPPEGPSTFRVMTQNLYLGGDLDLFTTGDADLPLVVEEIWASVVATDFGERAKLLADGIEASGADLVGVQEASLWRTQAPGDGFPLPNATAVAYDFLDLLVRELAARGLEYVVAATVVNGDLELAGAGGSEYRLTDRDAILAKATLPIVSTASGTFPHLGTIELPPRTADGPRQRGIVPRGWVSVEIRAGGRTVRIVNAHLEAFSAEVAAQQAMDLVAVASPGQQPTVVLGDMNLPPGSAGYAVFAAPGTGLRDAWIEAQGLAAGFTCCWSPDLRGGALDRRIDLVFGTADLHATEAAVVNGTARTPGGLAPSDHAGVVIGFAMAPAAAQSLADAGRGRARARDRIDAAQSRRAADEATSRPALPRRRPDERTSAAEERIAPAAIRFAPPSRSTAAVPARRRPGARGRVFRARLVRSRSHRFSRGGSETRRCRSAPGFDASRNGRGAHDCLIQTPNDPRPRPPRHG